MAFKAILSSAVLAASFMASAVQAAPAIHIVYMGGPDCPYCVEWTRTELPKLRKTQAFQSIQFSSVTKLIRSPVPLSVFLPAEVKPYKDKLDKASGGLSGSPHFAVLVDGQIHDYFLGTRPAETFEKMIVSIQTGAPYPADEPRCLQLGKKWDQCAVLGKP